MTMIMTMMAMMTMSSCECNDDDYDGDLVIPMMMTHISEGEGGYEAELWSLFFPAAPPIPGQSKSQIPPSIIWPIYTQISPLFVLQLF